LSYYLQGSLQGLQCFGGHFGAHGGGHGFTHGFGAQTGLGHGSAHGSQHPQPVKTNAIALIMNNVDSRAFIFSPYFLVY